MKFSINKFPADLVTFTEETLNGKLFFLYSVYCGVSECFLFLRVIWKSEGQLWATCKRVVSLSRCYSFKLLTPLA